VEIGSGESGSPTRIAPERFARLAERDAVVETPEPGAAAGRARSDNVCIIVFSGEMDRIVAALNIAVGAATTGATAHLFFTFWAIGALRRGSGSGRGRDMMARLFGWMLPRGAGRLGLSRMNMAGIGAAVMRRRMRARGFAGCDELLRMARESGVQISVCSSVMDLMGIGMDDLIDYPGMESCGVATFVSRALEGGVALFI
jgi:peroxiredoxin family protein